MCHLLLGTSPFRYNKEIRKYIIQVTEFITYRLNRGNSSYLSVYMCVCV